ncbi:MAG: SEL1-like repeat protein [Deltaproteobacteria bacterium]|nr:SEL1-like repeat protein [Deltaproteobacteria bacterium]
MKALGTLLLLALAAQTGRAAEIVAVFDVEARRVALDRDALSALTDYLAARLAESGRFEVVPRSEIKARLTDEKAKTYRSCFDQACQIEIGRELAAEKTLAGQVVRIGKQCVVTVRLYDLKKGTMERAATGKGDCSEDGVMLSIDRVVRNLASSAPETWKPGCASAEDCLARARSSADAGQKSRAVALLTAAERMGIQAGDWHLADRAWDRAWDLLQHPTELDPELARELERACKQRRFGACQALGRLHKHAVRRPQRAAELFDIACRERDLPSCEDLADLYTEGAGVERNLVLAGELRERICQQGHLWACQDLAFQYSRGLGVSQDHEKARALYRKACQGGVEEACSR